ncbi:hypothetical protein [Piscirickettsia salmonis]|uniref:hypothetical protein n=1 Tax=Piscirickettsia salmonis TaxID=1238 RepID=UPI000332C5FB|nr:hypothetical protein [Piscirickettsia salmonis]ERL61378.1 hypothetical protein K661_02278 [Piscirickettsia salmonis LF-89 = ATCC VR-1361]
MFDFSGFYLSYNCYTGGVYGCDSTAIVLGEMALFLILNGDHQQPLSHIAKNDGLQGCIDYFIDHINEVNRHSEHIKAYSGLELLGQSNIDRIAQCRKRVWLNFAFKYNYN